MKQHDLYTSSQIRTACESDARLRCFVDLMVRAVSELEITPAEARACAVYACEHVEAHRVHMITLNSDDILPDVPLSPADAKALGKPYPPA